MSLDKLSPKLREAILSVPSLIVIILIVYASLEPVSELFEGHALKATIKTIQTIMATLLGIILYSIGDFWDEYFFDKRYSVRYPDANNENFNKKVEGKWLQRVDRPFGVYPAGVPLKNVRDKFVRSDEDLERIKGYGCYEKAKRKLEKSDLWKEVEWPLWISKLVRSLIWPLVLIAIGSGCFYLWNLFSTGELMHLSILVFFLSICIAQSATVPYCQFRVKHMLSLYETALKPRFQGE